MKKVLFLLVVIIIACDRNNEEKMFYNFMDVLMTDSINKSVEDINFKIISIKKVGNVRAQDSIDLLNVQRTFLEENMKERTSLIIDDLKRIKEFEEKINEASSAEIKSNFQLAIDETQALIDSRREILDNDELLYKKLLKYLIELKQNTAQVVSTKYEVSYSIDDSITKTPVTIVSEAFTNADNTKFVLIKNY